MRDSTMAMLVALVWWSAQVATGRAEYLAAVVAFTCTALICRTIERRPA
jgi:hypothetical protein